MAGRTLTLLLVLISTVALAACGGSSSEDKTKDFAKQFEPINTQLLATGAALGQEIQTAQGKSNAEIATAFSALATKVGAQLTALKATTPPDDLQPTVDALEAGLASAQQDLTDIADGATANDVAKVRAATVKLLKDSQTGIRDPRRKLVKATGIKSAS